MSKNLKSLDTGDSFYGHLFKTHRCTPKEQKVFCNPYSLTVVIKKAGRGQSELLVLCLYGL